LLDQRDQLRQLMSQALSRRSGLALHHQQNLLRLSERGLCDAQQLAIGFF
jgi:hypothetical protein